MTDAQTAPEADELSTILPQSDRLKVVCEDGDVIEVRVKRLKTMELLGVLRILTGAFGTSTVAQLQLNTENPEAMQADMMAMMLMAIPNAAIEFVDLINSVVEPIDPEKDTEKKLRAELRNPEADAVLDIFEVIAVQEKDDLHALVGKLKSLWDRVGKLYLPKSRQKKEGSKRRSTS